MLTQEGIARLTLCSTFDVKQGGNRQFLIDQHQSWTTAILNFDIYVWIEKGSTINQ